MSDRIREIIAKARAEADAKEPQTVVEMLMVLEEIEKELPPEPVPEFNPGEIVSHPIFGCGEVIWCKSGGISASILIDFRGWVGRKEMCLAFCQEKITRVTKFVTP